MIGAPPFTVSILPPSAVSGDPFDFSIDAPQPHKVYESLTITFRGFVLRKDRSLPAPDRLLFMIDGQQFWACDIGKPRPDVAKALADRAWLDPSDERDLLCGFDSVLPSFLSDNPDRAIDVFVDFQPGTTATMTPPLQLCSLRFESHGRFAKSDGVGIAVVNSIGRSGSSLLSRVLGHHPMMFVPTLQGQYGEVFILGFFARALAVLSSEGALSFVNKFASEPEFTMLMSGYFGMDEQADGLEDDLRRGLDQILFRHGCQMHSEAVEAVTRYVAQRKPTACYWLEKSWNNFSLNLMRAMNRNVKEIILIRNPSDFWRSQELYQRKIRSDPTERMKHARSTFAKYSAIACAAHDRREIACIIRYEDLTGLPEATIRRICDYLAIDCGPEFLASSCRMIREGGELKERMQTDESGGEWAEDFHKYLATLSHADRTKLDAFCESAGYRLSD